MVTTQLSPKDPDEVLDYVIDWSEALDADEVASVAFILEDAAGLTITSTSHGLLTSTVWLAGGLSGQTAVIVARITTTGGRTLERAFQLAIVSTTQVQSGTGYDAPTPADLQIRFPRFVDVPTEVLEDAMAQGTFVVDLTWSAGDFRQARMLYAAHVLTLDGFGTGAESEVHANGLGAFSSMKSGSLQLNREKPTGGDSMGMLGQTTYGQRFYELAARNRCGPISTGSGANIGISPNARDVPRLPGLDLSWTTG